MTDFSNVKEIIRYFELRRIFFASHSSFLKIAEEAMKRVANHRTQTSLHGAVNDNGDPLLSLGPIHIDPALVSAIDTWVGAQKDPKPSRSEAVSMALYEWAAGMGLTLHQPKLNAQTLLKEVSVKPDFNKFTSKRSTATWTRIFQR